ncbi:MAG: SPOR domain-containing protein [Candidatus Eisenbacteria bacterium]|nr:SPOR domain-containing protein [Candidatus Eisenbacteria bacterium]
MSRRFSAILLLAALTGCGGRPKPETNVDPSIAAAPDNFAGPTLAPPAAVPIVPAIQLVDGFRVQLFQSTLLRDAEQFRDAAAARLDRPIYVEYQAPVYRVRAGDFVTREDAETWRNGLAARGYERAEVVPTLVRSAG